MCWWYNAKGFISLGTHGKKAYSSIIVDGACVHILAIPSDTSAYSTTEQYKLLSNFKVENESETERQRDWRMSTSTHSANNVCLYEWLLCENWRPQWVTVKMGLAISSHNWYRTTKTKHFGCQGACVIKKGRRRQRQRRCSNINESNVNSLWRLTTSVILLCTVLLQQHHYCFHLIRLHCVCYCMHAIYFSSSSSASSSS